MGGDYKSKYVEGLVAELAEAGARHCSRVFAEYVDDGQGGEEAHTRNCMPAGDGWILDYRTVYDDGSIFSIWRRPPSLFHRLMKALRPGA